MKPINRISAPPATPKPPWVDDSPKAQTAISGASITAQLSNLQDLCGQQDHELAALRSLQSYARRVAGMPQEPDDDTPVPNVESLADCASRLRVQHEMRRAVMDGIRVALGAA